MVVPKGARVGAARAFYFKIKLMSERLLKQIKIFLIFISPLLIFLFFSLYKFLSPKPTCFDNIKNQGEVDIDCGGPCPPCEVKKLEPLRISSKRFISYKDGSYDFVFKIFNPNEKYGLEKLSYYFELYDKEGKKIFETPKETSFIYPNETRWLIIQNVKAPEFDDFKPKVEINDYDWKEFEEKFSSRDLIYYEPKIEKLEIGGYRISFNVYNSSIYDFDKIEAIIFLYNKENSLIGLTRTYFQIKSKETQKVESIIDFLPEKPEAIEIFFQVQK
jgi:hypothetical protein